MWTYLAAGLLSCLLLPLLAYVVAKAVTMGAAAGRKAVRRRKRDHNHHPERN